MFYQHEIHQLRWIFDLNKELAFHYPGNCTLSVMRRKIKATIL